MHHIEVPETCAMDKPSQDYFFSQSRSTVFSYKQRGSLS